VVHVLGAFDVWHGDRDATPSALPAAVVQLLAIHDGRLHRSQLAEALWPDAAPWVGIQRLRNLLHRLRRHTGGLVAAEGRDIVRFATDTRVDLAEFLTDADRAISLANTDPPAALATGIPALMRYRGPLLADQPYADWAHPRRVYVADRHHLLLHALAHASDQTGDTYSARMYRARATHTPY